MFDPTAYVEENELDPSVSQSGRESGEIFSPIVIKILEDKVDIGIELSNKIKEELLDTGFQEKYIEIKYYQNPEDLNYDYRGSYRFFIIDLNLEGNTINNRKTTNRGQYGGYAVIDKLNRFYANNHKAIIAYTAYDQKETALAKNLST